MKPRYAMIAALMLMAATMVQTPQARAQAYSAATATGSCQGSRPTYEASLRKRPLAMENEGPASVFISCTSQSGYLPSLVVQAMVAAVNWNDAAVELTCTLVDGPFVGLAFYYTKTITLGPMVRDVVVWLPSEYGRTSFSGYEHFSCRVPPGVEIGVVGYAYWPTF